MARLHHVAILIGTSHGSGRGCSGGSHVTYGCQGKVTSLHPQQRRQLPAQLPQLRLLPVAKVGGIGIFTSLPMAACAIAVEHLLHEMAVAQRPRPFRSGQWSNAGAFRVVSYCSTRSLTTRRAGDKVGFIAQPDMSPGRPIATCTT